MKSYKILLPVLLVLGVESYADGTTYEIPSGNHVLCSTSEYSVLIDAYKTKYKNSFFQFEDNSYIYLDAKNTISGNSGTYTLTFHTKENVTLKKVQINGTIINSDGGDAVKFIGDKEDVFTITDGLHFGKSAKISAKDKQALGIKNHKSFNANIINNGQLGDKETKIGILLRKEANGLSMDDSIKNYGNIEAYRNSLYLNGTVKGGIFNYGNMISYGDDRIKEYDSIPAAIDCEAEATNTVTNYGLIKGRRTFYTENDLKVTIINYGTIDGWIDDHINDIAVEITNHQGGRIISAGVAGASVTNSGSILIKPEPASIGEIEDDYTYKGVDPDQSLRVMTTLNNSGTIEADGHYWVANTTINTGTLKVNCVKKGLHGDTAITIDNQGDFSFNYVTSSGKGNEEINKNLGGNNGLLLTNSKNVTMCAGNTIGSYTSTAGKLQLIVDFDKHEHATNSYSLTDAMLAATEITLDGNSVIEIKPKHLKQLKSFKKTNDLITILKATSTLSVDDFLKDAEACKSAHKLIKFTDLKKAIDDSNTLTAKIIFINPSELLKQKITTKADKPAIRKEVLEFADVLFNVDENTKEARAVEILAKAYGDITEVETVEEIEKIIEAIVPEKTEAVAAVATELGSQSGNTVTTHMSNSRSGVNSSGENGSCAIWGQTTINSATKKTTAECSGYNSSFSSLTLGLENNVNQLIYGISWGYNSANVVLDNSKNKAYQLDVKMNSFSIYATKTLDNYFTEASLSYSRADNKVANGKGAATRCGDYTSQQYQLMFAFGKSFATASMFILEPKLIMKMSHLDTDSCQLNNEAQNMPESISNTSSQNLYTGLGFKVSYSLLNSKARTVPFINVAYYNNMHNQQTAKEIIFINQKFISNAEQIKHQFNADIGVDFAFDNLELFAAYSFNWKKNYKANNLTLQVKYLF